MRNDELTIQAEVRVQHAANGSVVGAQKNKPKNNATVCYLQHTVSPSSSEDFSRDLCAATSGASSAAAFTSAFASSAGAAGSATGLHQTQSFMQNGIAYVSSHECKSGGVK